MSDEGGYNEFMLQNVNTVTKPQYVVREQPSYNNNGCIPPQQPVYYIPQQQVVYQQPQVQQFVTTPAPVIAPPPAPVTVPQQQIMYVPTAPPTQDLAPGLPVSQNGPIYEQQDMAPGLPVSQNGPIYGPQTQDMAPGLPVSQPTQQQGYLVPLNYGTSQQDAPPLPPREDNGENEDINSMGRRSSGVVYMPKIYTPRKYYVTVAYPGTKFGFPYKLMPSIYRHSDPLEVFAMLFGAHVTLTAEYALHAKAVGSKVVKMNTIFSDSESDAVKKLQSNANSFVDFLVQKHPNQAQKIKNEFYNIFFTNHTFAAAQLVDNILDGGDQERNVQLLKQLYITNLNEIATFFQALGYNRYTIEYYWLQHLHCTIGQPIDQSQGVFLNTNTMDSALVTWGKEGYLHEILFNPEFDDYETFLLQNMSFRQCLNDGVAFGRYLDNTK